MLSCCHDVVSVACVCAAPRSVAPLFVYSRNLSLSGAPALSARAHTVPVYVPAAVGFAQSGESLSTQLWFVRLVFVSCAAQPPEWPPATRVAVTPFPEPDVFQ